MKNTGENQGRGLAFYRERILRVVLAAGLFLGLFVFIPTVIMAITERLWIVLTMDLVIYASGVAVLVTKRLRLEVRCAITLVLVYGVGFSIISNMGLISGGPVCLFAFAVLSGLLLGLRAAVLAIIINAVTLLGFGWLQATGQWGQDLVFFPSMIRGIVAWSTYVLMNAVSSIATAFLVHGLDELSARDRETARCLQKEHDLLVRETRERIRTQEALAESEQRFRRLADNAKDMIYRMSLPDGAYDYVSPASLELFGYTPKEMYANPLLVRDVIHPDWAGYFERQWADLLAGNMPPFYEYQIIHRTGGMRWLHQRNVLILNPEGKPDAIEGIVTDVTQRKLEEEHLRFFKTAVDYSSDAIGMSTPQGIHWYQNRAFDSLFGDIGPDPPATLYADQNQGRKVFETIMDGGQWNGEVEMNDRHGNRVSVLLRAYSIKDGSGRVSGLVGVHTDMTQRTRARQEREKLIRDLQKALENIQTLQGLLPICSGCKKIRDDTGYWNQIETYIEKHSKALFTHSLCPDCLDRLYGDKDWYQKSLDQNRTD